MPENTLLKELEKIDDTALERVRDVIQCGGDVTMVGDYGETCLHVLCSPQFANNLNYVVPLVYMLVDAGVNINGQDQEGNTVLHVCAINEPLINLVITFLRLGADPTIENSFGVCATEVAEDENIRKILEKYSPGLYNAIKEGEEDKVREMAGDWFNFDRKLHGQKLDKLAKKNSHTSLYEFIKSKKSQLGFIHAVLAGNAARVKELIDDADVNVCDKFIDRKWPLVADAISNGYLDVAKYLLKKVDVNQTIETLSGETQVLFVFALKTVTDPDSKFIKLLLKKADLTQYSGDPVEQLHTFWKRGFPEQILDLYIKHGFSLSFRFSTGQTLREKILLSSYKERESLKQNLSFVDNYVLKCVRDGQKEELQQLVLGGYGSVMVRDLKGRSAIQLAKEAGQDDMVEFLEQVAVLTKTIHGIHKDIENGNLQGMKHKMKDTYLAKSRDLGGRTPLHKAVLYDRKFVIMYLLKTYPDVVNCKDMNGRTPLHYACCLHEDHDIENMLIKAGVDQTVIDVKGNTALDYKISNDDIIAEERNAQHGCHEHLLSTYLDLCATIEHNDVDLLRRMLENLAGMHIDDVNQLPDFYPDLDFQQLLFLCVDTDQESMATLMLMKGANHDITDTLDDRNERTLLEAAEDANMMELVAVIKKKNKTKSEPRGSWQLSINDSVGSWQDDCHSSTDSITPPPNKRSSQRGLVNTRDNRRDSGIEGNGGDGPSQEEYESDEEMAVNNRRSASCVIL